MLRIYADTREKQSGIPDLLRDLGALVFLQQLSVGDYIVADGVAVERKNVFDLMNSVFDKRFFDQLERLREVYSKVFILVEGNLEGAKTITTKWKIFNSALITATVDYDVGVLYSLDKRESAEVLVTLARRYQERGVERKPISLHDKPKFESLDEMQLYLVQSLPNVGGKIALRLLTEFSTVRNICNSSIADLERVMKSRKKAELLYKIFNTKFSSNSDKKSASLTDFVEE
ncbi:MULTISPECIES: 3'-flap repair endonuclease Xpf [Metallosphaera]|uniref:ERCC4 domain protein n=3 Tax=Metallosphaera TaxID=41980 RepID=A4YCV8_METS5|nr:MULTISPECIES: 3'-flap repair endonuclease Xpf [Metallosphaera]ABP94260.1 ERCC4 domain protein [Metallosphaera sedula DSM 5348]AIM26247.1 ERCC4 domain protein [Metallosphaera sedula]AKV73264.1 multidrug MFS transporter [Metallosphaera sedula]AKV75508.1 multidrug MFS transporter [Metallosphaera sedula]AKV77754.1 multidrug MFS transporter [Metallosphaera sedula]